MVYLIHFDKPIGDVSNPHGYAQHYIGWVEEPEGLEDRLDQHRSGWGARIMAYVSDHNIPWAVVRTWDGDRALERRLKRRKDAPKLCPVCNPDGWRRRGNYNYEEEEDSTA